MLTRPQIEAMDDTVGHHAQAYARANLHLLEDACGVVESREQVLQRRIGTRQGLLASGPMTEAARRRLEDANELDAQELDLRQHPEGTAADLGAWLVKGALVVGALLGAAHFVAWNWGL